MPPAARELKTLIEESSAVNPLSFPQVADSLKRKKRSHDSRSKPRLAGRSENVEKVTKLLYNELFNLSGKDRTFATCLRRALRTGDGKRGHFYETEPAYYGNGIGTDASFRDAPGARRGGHPGAGGGGRPGGEAGGGGDRRGYRHRDRRRLGDEVIESFRNAKKQTQIAVRMANSRDFTILPPGTLSVCQYNKPHGTLMSHAAISLLLLHRVILDAV